MCRDLESAALAAAAERSRRLAKVYEEEDVLAGVKDKQDDAASARGSCNQPADEVNGAHDPVLQIVPTR
jgi:hypothetical protein